MDGGGGGQPVSALAAAGVRPAAADAVAALDGHGAAVGRGQGAGDDGVRIAPVDLPADVRPEEAGQMRDGRVDLGDPAGRAIGPRKLVQHIELGDRIDLEPANRARREHAADADLGHRPGHGLRQAALPLGLRAVPAHQRQ